MKNKFTTIFLTAFYSVAASQIPNSGFESWTNMGNYSDPNQWGTLNAITSFDDVYTCIKGTPGNPGTSYLMLRSQTVKGLAVVPAIAATGIIDTGDYSVGGGFPFTQRPQTLTGNWQYMSYTGIDFGFIAVYLTKWDTAMNTRDTISATVYSLTGMAMVWVPFNIYLNYQMGSYPDSAQIVLSASAMSKPADGDYLYVDNLDFAGYVAGTKNNSFFSSINIFPNPASDYLNIICENLSGGQIQIELFDIVGKKISTLYSGIDAKGQMIKSFDVSNISKGVYWMMISERGKYISKKIVII